MQQLLSHSAQIPNKPELLAPAGSWEKCQVAFLYGADAVYAGGKDYSLRAFTHNLNREQLAGACHHAHRLGKKLYVAVNIFAHEGDIEGLTDFLGYLQDINVDAIIVSDPGVICLAKRHAPDLPIHLSTQANTSNSLSANFWEERGIKRINLAREITFDALQRIRRRTRMELEIFVHGAQCMAYSGRCLLSAYLNRRSSNQGLCTQPCRWPYKLIEEKRPGQYFNIDEDARGAYIMNSKDLCLMPHLGELMRLGVDSFKIEGRMKGILYLASVIRSYRQAIDGYWHQPEKFEVAESWTNDLERISHRPYTCGLLFEDSHFTQDSTSSAPYLRSHTLAGVVRELAPELFEESRDSATQSRYTVVEVRSRLVPGIELEFLNTDGSFDTHLIESFENLQGEPLSVAHPNQWIKMRVPFRTFALQIIRMQSGS